jgi:hypothetical protein
VEDGDELALVSCGVSSGKLGCFEHSTSSRSILEVTFEILSCCSGVSSHKIWKSSENAFKICICLSVQQYGIISENPQILTTCGTSLDRKSSQKVDASVLYTRDKRIIAIFIMFFDTILYVFLRIHFLLNNY